MLVKRTLTTLQITQFLVGASYAMSHSFISYVIPVTTTITETVTPSAPTASSASAAAAAEPTAATGLLENLKALVFGAASKVSEAAAAVSQPAASEAEPQIRVRTETNYVTQQCITTDGSTFAIWLNVLYLAPLTYLFVKFFISSYLRSGKAAAGGRGNGEEKTRRMSNVMRAEKAGWDAAKEVEREVYGETSEEVIVEEEVEEKAQVQSSPKATGRMRTRRTKLEA